MDLAELGERLDTAARQTNERRLVVLAGDRQTAYAALERLLSARSASDSVLVGTDHREEYQRLAPDQTKQLLGTTHKTIIYDCHQGFSPNRLGRVCGAIDGGGLGILMTPSFEEWPGQSDTGAGHLAVDSYPSSDVSGRFRTRLIRTFHRHDGVAIIDLDSSDIVSDGTSTDRRPASLGVGLSVPETRRFPASLYERCRTSDQRRCLSQFETLIAEPGVLVVTAPRGRGKSSVSGLAAAELAGRGDEVVITAPEPENTTPLFQQVAAVLGEDSRQNSHNFQVADSGGAVHYRSPREAITADADMLIVDEAAALPVPLLEKTLAIDRVAFVTTIHGYEGAGRGFSLAFQETLNELNRPVNRCELTEPIRYAETDPIEPWLADALLLDARPPVDQQMTNIDSGRLSYRVIDPDTLIDHEQQLRELFGLLVYAHYRTEPDDLERILDAPNTHLRALYDGDTVVAAAVLAQEGGLSSKTCRAMRSGQRIRGHMIPGLLVSQLSDPDAGHQIGFRVMRIVTHPAVQSQGYGSQLLEEIRDEAIGNGSSSALTEADWLGVAFGATPPLVQFWRANGYRPVHLATTANDRSGRHSTVMVDPVTAAGSRLYDRHGRRFAGRIRDVLADSLCELDPDVVRSVLRGIDQALSPPPAVSQWEWAVIEDVATGHGTLDVAPGPFSRLAVQYFADYPDPDTAPLTHEEERLLVCRALQYQNWGKTTAQLGYPSTRTCRQAFVPIAKELINQYRQEDTPHRGRS